MQATNIYIYPNLLPRLEAYLFRILSYKNTSLAYMTSEDIPAYLKSGTRQNKNRIKRYENGIPIILSSRKDLYNYIKNSINTNDNQIVAYAKTNSSLRNQIIKKSNNSIDIANTYLELSSDDIRHTISEHQIAKENEDMNMSIEEFVYALENIENGEVLQATIHQSGDRRIVIAIQSILGRIILVELFSKSAGSLRLKTAWKISENKYRQKYRSELNSAGN